MPKVLIPNRGVHDYSEAEKYGELEFVTKGQQNKYSVGNMFRIWVKALKDSHPDDHVMITSLTVLCCIGCMVFALKHGCINLLLFRDSKYISRRLMLQEALSGFEKED